MQPATSIRIGTMIRASDGKAPESIAAIADMGFESFEPFFWQTTNGQDLAELGKRCRDAIGDRDITISTLGMFGNPLEDRDLDRQTLQGWKDCIDNAHHFGATCVAGFTGRIRGKPLTDSLPAYKKLWSELATRAADKGVRIAFENCAMDGNWASGDWNIAHNPDAWELMFNETPARQSRAGMGALPPDGLSDRPAAADPQMGAQVLPRPRQGRDHPLGGDPRARHLWQARSSSSCARRALATATGPTSSRELRLAGWSGSIDIEGWHDPVYRDALEMTGPGPCAGPSEACQGRRLRRHPGLTRARSAKGRPHDICNRRRCRCNGRKT